MTKIIPILSISFILFNCAPPEPIIIEVPVEKEDKLTLGTVQSKIKKGMNQTEVLEVLGSPNIVTTDGERREVWVYDKISTKAVVSRDQIGASILIIGGSSEAGASERQQRTLTVIIKFNKDKKVRDFAYHTSRF